jgi:DNA-binding CsgD family transcriptional regulator
MPRQTITHAPFQSACPGAIRLRGRALRLVEALAAEQGRPSETVLEELLAAALDMRRARLAPPPAWRALTRREREVILLLLQDCSDRRIARALHIDPETVRTHVRNILRKYGVRTRADLRRRVREEGEPAAN